MRLTIKLTVILVALVVIAMAAQSLRTSRHLAARHLRESQQDFLVLAAALATATDAMLEAHGREPALGDLFASMRHHIAIAMRIVPPGHPGVIPLAELQRLVANERYGPLTRQTDASGDALTIRVALGVDVSDTEVLVIELAQNLDAHRAYMADMRRQQLVDVAILSTLCGVAILLLCILFIDHPVRILLGQALTIGNGELSLRSHVAQRDELATLAEELSQMRERLADAKRQAREEHRARTAALDQLRHADRLSTVGKIASGIAHEVGTPLNVIVGRAALITSAPDCPAEIAANARTIAAQANHVARIIRQLLDFARNGALCRRSIEIADLLDRAQRLLEPIADERGVSITVESRAEAIAIVDEGKMLQVITNLIINGIQAMPRGGVVRIDYGFTEVAAPPSEFAVPGRYLYITVKDEGVGIAPDKLDHIFEPFFTTKAASEGTGLGLPICDGIVREHGGFILVKSDVGKGSVFTVYIPQGEER